jgi:O-antigen ligase
MANPNEVSAVLAFCFPAFVRKKWAYFIPLIVVGLILSKSFGGMLSVMVGLAVYASFFIDKFFVLIFFVSIVAAFSLIESPGIKERFDTWMIGLKLFKQHFLFGSGIGHWKYVFSEIDIFGNNKRMLTAHNEFIQATFEMGIGFVFIIIGYLVDVYKKLKNLNLIYTMAIVIITINSAVNFSFHIAVTAYLALTWLSLINKEVQNETERDFN